MESNGWEQQLTRFPLSLRMHCQSCEGRELSRHHQEPPRYNSRSVGAFVSLTVHPLTQPDTTIKSTTMSLITPIRFCNLRPHFSAQPWMRNAVVMHASPMPR